MYGYQNSTAYFSGNSVVVRDSAMARRKGVLTFRLVMVVCLGLLLGSIMAGRIFLTNQITVLRARVADLESRKEFLEAGSARLYTQWNTASSGEVIVERARRELGLIIPEHPGLVLVCAEPKSERQGTWQKFKDGLPGQDLARITSDAEDMMAGAMISLTPRGAKAGTYDNGGD
jgi:cell division protein FtsB